MKNRCQYPWLPLSTCLISLFYSFPFDPTHIPCAVPSNNVVVQSHVYVTMCMCERAWALRIPVSTRCFPECYIKLFVLSSSNLLSSPRSLSLSLYFFFPQHLQQHQYDEIVMFLLCDPINKIYSKIFHYNLLFLLLLHRITILEFQSFLFTCALFFPTELFGINE